VSAEAAAEAEKSVVGGGGELSVPSDARADRKNVGTFYWTERVKIIDVSAEETETNNGDTHIVVDIRTEILPTRPTGDASGNATRKAPMKPRLNWAAWDKYMAMSEGEKASVLKESGPGTFGGQVKMHRGSIGRIGQVLRVAGLYEGGDLEPELLEHAFPEQGLSPLVGLEFDADIKQGPNDKGDKWPEISKIIMPDNVDLPEGAVVTANVTTL
jgi:hypothetical protein